MKKTITCMLVTIAVIVTAGAELSDVETKYLRQFANRTGGMGIGFAPEHTYDYGFRQAVLNSEDDDMRRLPEILGKFGNIGGDGDASPHVQGELK